MISSITKLRVVQTLMQQSTAKCQFSCSTASINASMFWEVMMWWINSIAWKKLRLGTFRLFGDGSQRRCQHISLSWSPLAWHWFGHYFLDVAELHSLIWQLFLCGSGSTIIFNHRQQFTKDVALVDIMCDISVFGMTVPAIQLRNVVQDLGQMQILPSHT